MKKINGHYIRGECYRESPSPFWNLEGTKTRKLTMISTLNINKPLYHTDTKVEYATKNQRKGSYSF